MAALGPGGDIAVAAGINQTKGDKAAFLLSFG